MSVLARQDGRCAEEKTVAGARKNPFLFELSIKPRYGAPW